MKTLWILILGMTLCVYGNMVQPLADEHPTEKSQEHPSENHPEKKADQVDQKDEAAKSAAESHDDQMHSKKHKAKHRHGKKMKKMHRHKNHTWNKNSVEKDLLSFVDKERSKDGGVFSVQDEIQSTVRQLVLEKIHTDKIVQLSDGTSFVCADFKDANGDRVDVDFFMSPTAQGNVEQVRKIQIHKVNGSPRYTYVQKNGQWTQVKTN